MIFLYATWVRILECFFDFQATNVSSVLECIHTMPEHYTVIIFVICIMYLIFSIGFAAMKCIV
jgi:hypothetical protein